MRLALLISHHPVTALGMAATWASDGDAVSAVLLDGASALVRRGHAHHALLQRALSAGVAVSVHDGALRRRGLGADDAVKVVTIDEVADLVADGADRVMWT